MKPESVSRFSSPNLSMTALSEFHPVLPAKTKPAGFGMLFRVVDYAEWTAVFGALRRSFADSTPHNYRLFKKPSSLSSGR